MWKFQLFPVQNSNFNFHVGGLLNKYFAKILNLLAK